MVQRVVFEEIGLTLEGRGMVEGLGNPLCF